MTTTSFVIRNRDQPTIVKDPNAVLDYSWDWAAWLAEVPGDAIASYDVTVESGITLQSDAVAGAIVTAWIAGGTAGQRLSATCRIVTTDGRTDDRSIWFDLRER
jgi:hypothetical protein